MLAPKVIHHPKELQCPVCRKPGECDRHLVESWQEGRRPDHLGRLLKEHPNAFPMRAPLRERFPNPETCFEGCVLVEHDEHPPSGHLPLFTGEALIHSNRPVRWISLYHREGPQLLEQYQRLILAQLSRSRQVRTILKTLKRGSSKRSRGNQGSLFQEEAPDAGSRHTPEPPPALPQKTRAKGPQPQRTAQSKSPATARATAPKPPEVSPEAASRPRPKPTPAPPATRPPEPPAPESVGLVPLEEALPPEAVAPEPREAAPEAPVVPDDCTEVPDYVDEMAEHLAGPLQPLPDENDPVLYQLIPDDAMEIGAFMSGLDSEEDDGSSPTSRSDRSIWAEEMMKNLL